MIIHVGVKTVSPSLGLLLHLRVMPLAAVWGWRTWFPELWRLGHELNMLGQLDSSTRVATQVWALLSFGHEAIRILCSSLQAFFSCHFNVFLFFHHTPCVTPLEIPCRLWRRVYIFRHRRKLVAASDAWDWQTYWTSMPRVCLSKTRNLSRR